LALLPFTFSFFTGGSFHAGTDKIRAKFGDIRCRKSWPGHPDEAELKQNAEGNIEHRTSNPDRSR
jgi:hypothetical protein